MDNNTKKFPPPSPISTQVISIHWCLFWLLGSLGKFNQPLDNLFATKNNSLEVGPPFPLSEQSKIPFSTQHTSPEGCIS